MAGVEATSSESRGEIKASLLLVLRVGYVIRPTNNRARLDNQCSQNLSGANS